MTYLPALFGAFTFALGITMGRRMSDASRNVDRMVEAFRRDCDVLDVADMATDSSE